MIRALALTACLACAAPAAQSRDLAYVYAAMDPPVDRAQWHLHDPSRILDMPAGDAPGRQIVAVTGKEQAHGYACGLETWHRTDPGAPWLPDQCLFIDKPAWIAAELPSNDGAFWAPDFTPDGDLVYAVSAGFEETGSCVGLARRTDDGWVDIGRPLNCVFDPHGEEVETIDPTVFRSGFRSRSQDYLIAGGGMVFGTALADGAPLDWYTADHPDWTILAARPGQDERWVEAAQLVEAAGAYWLFVNWGACCRGVASTYELRVGRGDTALGPFFDVSGVPMAQGGGTLFMDSTPGQIGPGHAAFRRDAQGLILSYHFYDAARNGLPWLGEARVAFTDGWPRLAGRLPVTLPDGM